MNSSRGEDAPGVLSSKVCGVNASQHQLAADVGIILQQGTQTREDKQCQQQDWPPRIISPAPLLQSCRQQHGGDDWQQPGADCMLTHTAPP